MDLQQDKIIQLEGKIETEEPYTTFGKVVSNSEASINIGAFTKLLYDKHGIRYNTTYKGSPTVEAIQAFFNIKKDGLLGKVTVQGFQSRFGLKVDNTKELN